MGGRPVERLRIAEECLNTRAARIGDEELRRVAETFRIGAVGVQAPGWMRYPEP